MDCRKNRAPRPLHQPPKIPLRTTPGERERVATLSHPVPREDVGEQSAPRPASSETNSLKRTFPASPETKFRVTPTPGERERVATLSHPVPRGDVGEQSAPRPASSETNSFKRTFPASPETKFRVTPTPGERERVATLSLPVPRGDVGEQSAPRPCRRKQRPQENSPHRREPKSAPEQPPGERERVATLSHPVTRGGVGERSAPRSRRRKQRPQKNSLLRRKPKSPSEQPRESSRGCEPSRLPIEAGDLRVGRGR